VRQRVYGFWIVTTALVGLAIGAVCTALIISVVPLSAGRIVKLIWALPIIGGGIASGAGTNIAKKRFKPRFRKWLAAAGRA
jgi:hypothetical protein